MPRPSIRSWLPHVLWIDGLAGLAAGVIILSLRRWLADVYGLPVQLVTGLGLVNLAYAPWGLSLAPRRRRPVGAIAALATANAAWAVVCVALAVRHSSSASPLGVVALLGEAAIVGGLAAVEWRYRRAIADRRGP